MVTTNFRNTIRKLSILVTFVFAAHVALPQSNFQSDGTLKSPQSVPVGCAQKAQVDTGVSYYVTSVEATSRHRIALFDLSANADLYGYASDAQFQHSAQVSDRPGTADEHIEMQPAGDRLYFSVDGQHTKDGATFYVLVNDLSGGFVDEGTPNAPVLIRNDADYYGQVVCNSYYVAKVRPNLIYDIVMTPHVDDADINVYHGLEKGIPIASGFSSGTEAELVRVLSTTDHILLHVDGALSTDGTSFSLRVTEGTKLINEGTLSTPIELTVDEPYTGSVFTESYYSVHVDRGRIYRVQLIDSTDDTDLMVYHDINEGQIAGISDFGFMRTELVVVDALSDELHILVDGNSTEHGATYTILVEDDGPPRQNEGIVTVVPFQLQLGNVHRGQVSTNRSYYAVGVRPGLEYEVKIANLTDDADLYVYDDDETFTRIQALSNELGTNCDSVTVTADGDQLYIVVDGINYTHAGADFDLSVKVVESSDY